MDKSLENLGSHHKAPVFGAVLVGDELLSGKRSDAHMPYLIKALAQYGFELSWLKIVGDDEALLVRTFQQTKDSGAVVFSFGGIGATPDDLTRQSAAKAFGLTLEIHVQGAAILTEKFGEEDVTGRRLQMVNFPKGASLLLNPVNQVPAFNLGEHYFVPGFPSMAHAMIDKVLAEKYAHYKQPKTVERIVVVRDTPESQLIATMEQFLAKYPGIKISSLPNATTLKEVELGVKGQLTVVEACFSELITELEKQKRVFEIMN